MRYRLDIVGCDVAETVRNAGGLLVDRVMAGWDVTALLASVNDTKALEILGVAAADVKPPIQEWRWLPLRRMVGVNTDAFVEDAWVRRAVLRILDQGRTEVIMWGNSRPGELGCAVDVVRHEVSAAGRAFKKRALAAVGDTDPVSPTETFRCGVMSSVFNDAIGAVQL